MAARFGSFPSWWIRDGVLRGGFIAGPKTGEHIAALKVMLALAMIADFRTREASVSLSDLESLTGLSRPMVVRGIKVCRAHMLLDVIEGYKNTYVMSFSPTDKQWAKVPIAYLKKELKGIPNRGAVVLSALKIYLQLLTDRPNDSDEMYMTHETIVTKVAVQTRNVKPALDVLFNHLLISISTESIPEKKFRVLNKFRIRGL